MRTETLLKGEMCLIFSLEFFHLLKYLSAAWEFFTKEYVFIQKSMLYPLLFQLVNLFLISLKKPGSDGTHLESQHSVA